MTKNLIAPPHLPDGAVLRAVEYTVYNDYTGQSAFLG
jgi:hypothetical protein